MTRALLLALCGLVLAACGGDKRPREAAPAAPLTLPPAAPPASAPVAALLPPPAAVSVPVAEPEPTPEELPLPADFEAEAARQITAANFRAQLDAIEREMNAQK